MDQKEGLFDSETKDYSEIELSSDLQWLKSRIGKFVSGGIYLIAGQPGIGKSTLGIQIALDLGRKNVKTLLILTEQSKDDLAKRAKLMVQKWKSEDVKKADSHVKTEENLYDLESLPSF